MARNWAKAKGEKLVRDRGADPVERPIPSGGGPKRGRRSKPKRRSPGISNPQASELGALCRELNLPYAGAKLRAAKADALIRDYRERVKLTKIAAADPITARQEQYLRALSAELAEPFPDGLGKVEASQRIQDALNRLGRS
jgi:hypothetical protein